MAGQEMLLKKNRADKKTVEKIFKEGKFINSPNLTFKFFITKNSVLPRISFIVPKNIAKLAVKRNLLRRRGYSALKRFLKDLPFGLSGVFIFKKDQNDILILENEIKKIFTKIN